MIREIKFRGKDICTGEWVVGYFVGTTDNVATIIPINNVNYDIGYVGESECSYCDTNTVGQFTGLYDKNGNEIYEGNILRYERYGWESKPLVVEFKHGAFGYTYEETDCFIPFASNVNFDFNPYDKDINFEIIGDIHDNPELLKGGK